jgi:hypothetical protein
VPEALARPVEEPAAERRLAERLAREQAEPVPEAVAELAAELARRHGPCVAAVAFYGSCLRKRTNEGVLDFYVVVDDYRSAHASRAMALANAWLPPSVFYCEWPHAGETLRTKYAVISTRDLLRGAGPDSLDCRIWARFCQPVAIAFARDDAARRTLVEVAVRSCRTFVERAWPVLPEREGCARFTAEALFQAGFGETYRAELRSERPETVRQLYAASAPRYEAVARDALEALAGRGRATVRETPAGFELRARPGERRRARLAWRLRRPVAKALAVAGLLKTAFTFGDWVPYVLWKIERHTAVRVEVSERQRRHPLIFGWPVILRVLRDGIFR